jgi:hypothetical protein
MYACLSVRICMYVCRMYACMYVYVCVCACVCVCRPVDGVNSRLWSGCDSVLRSVDLVNVSTVVYGAKEEEEEGEGGVGD